MKPRNWETGLATAAFIYPFAYVHLTNKLPWSIIAFQWHQCNMSGSRSTFSLAHSHWKEQKDANGHACAFCYEAALTLYEQWLIPAKADYTLLFSVLLLWWNAALIFKATSSMIVNALEQHSAALIFCFPVLLFFTSSCNILSVNTCKILSQKFTRPLSINKRMLSYIFAYCFHYISLLIACTVKSPSYYVYDSVEASLQPELIFMLLYYHFHCYLHCHKFGCRNKV